MVDDVEIKKIYQKYYSNIEILFELVKQTKGREIAFLGKENCVRCIKAHNVSYLKSNMDAFRFFKKSYNIYISSANYDNLPMFSFSPIKRKEQSDSFNLNYRDYLVGLDLFIDLDGSKEFLPFEDCDKLISVFNDFKVPYSLRLSGKGFHFVIPNDFFSLFNISFDKRILLYKEFVRSLSIIFDLKNIDLSVYDLRRVYKLPYSLDLKSMRVCVPLNDCDYDFLKIDSDYFSVENFLDLINSKRLIIRDRGICLRNVNSLSSKNVLFMFKEFLGDVFE